MAPVQPEFADSRRRLELLAQASAVLAESLDYETTLRNVVQLAVPELADWCSADLVQPDGSLRSIPGVHADPRKAVLLEQLQRSYPVGASREYGVWKAIESGTGEVLPEVPDHMIERFARDETHAALLREIGVRSYMVVPLAARGHRLGVLVFILTEAGRSYGDDDLLLAQDLAYRCGLAVDNATLLRTSRATAAREHEVVRTLQASLLPKVPPEIPGAEVAARYSAAGTGEVGGDFYDVFPSPGGWTIVIGDVCGKGPEAAALTGLARHTIRVAARYERSPSRVLKVLNDAVLAERTEGRFITVAMTRFEPTLHGARLTTACGGHPLPLILHPDGTVEEAARPGTVLGLVGSPELTDNAAVLDPGDSLVLYTDGVTESRTPDGLLGEERFRQMLSAGGSDSATELADRLEAELARVSVGEARDDIALITVRTP